MTLDLYNILMEYQKLMNSLGNKIMEYKELEYFLKTCIKCIGTRSDIKKS